MTQLNTLGSCDLLDVGRRALELGARRFAELARAVKADDHPLLDLLGKMTQDAATQAKEVEAQEALLTDAGRSDADAAAGASLSREFLTSLTKSLGEGPLHRDVALFFAESLEEETSRLFSVLADQARDWRLIRLFQDLADREQGNLRFLREVVLEG